MNDFEGNYQLPLFVFDRSLPISGL